MHSKFITNLPYVVQAFKKQVVRWGLPVLKLVKLKGTRWIAHRERALRLILHDWPILVQHASQVRMGRTAVQGRAAQLCFILLKPDVLLFMYLSYDLFVVFGRLSKTLQKNSTTIDTVLRFVVSARAELSRHDRSNTKVNKAYQ